MSVEIIPTDAVIGAEIRGVDLSHPLTKRPSPRSSRPLMLTRSYSSATSELHHHNRSPSPAALVISNSTSLASVGACPAARRL